MTLLFKFLFVFLGAAAGAFTRYWIGEAFRLLTQLPGWAAILLANLLGSLLMGFIFAWVGQEIWLLTHENQEVAASAITNFSLELLSVLLMVGFCGGLTTFSTFGLDTILLIYDNRWLQASLNITLSVVLCTAAVVMGMHLAGGIVKAI